MAARSVASASPDGNYAVHVVTFAVVRERATADPTRLDSPDTVIGAVAAAGLIPDDAREHFAVLYLDSQNRLVAAHAVSTGSLSASIVHPREVLGPALRPHLILVHNHPSGDPTPSREDVSLTRQVVEGARLLGLKVHDHVILGNGTGRWTSFTQSGLI